MNPLTCNSSYLCRLWTQGIQKYTNNRAVIYFTPTDAVVQKRNETKYNKINQKYLDDSKQINEYQKKISEKTWKLEKVKNFL